ncbi:MAG: anti-sigma factor domain-containing protein [Allosphingosinicella sp.]|uniref:anti-sigma factor n=1 Tax=Allosphingosinicella sp. TaxID=2823234 RepID=UPI00394E1344
MSAAADPSDRDLLAAEHALGLLEGEDLRAARRLAAEDPAFAATVAEWELRLAPLAADVEEAEPGPEVWRRIAAAIAEPGAGNPAFPGENKVVALRRSRTLWRAYAAGITAIAASLALVLVTRGSPDAPPVLTRPAPAPTMVAMLASDDSDAALSIAFDPAASILLVTPARLEGAAGHDHELWIIPRGGAPVSLGLVAAGRAQRIGVAPELRPHFQLRATLAVSVEPEGGSPTGQPTGAVIAAGELLSV